MRIKSGPGKPRLFQIIPKPSRMALSTQLCGPATHLEQSHGFNEFNEDNSYAHCSIVPETCDDGGQNTTCHKQTHISIEDMAVEKESHGDVPQGVDSLCGVVPETSEDGDQNTTRQKQTPDAIDAMAVEEDSRGKSTERIRIFDNGGQNTSCQKQTPNAVDNMVVEEEFCGKAPEKIHGTKVCSEIDWSEKKVCIKCDEGGKLLICSDSNCPLAVHEECMRCPAHFDSKGNFFCPYCSYKQVVLATRKAKKKAILAKKVLSVFLDRRELDIGPLNEKVDMVEGGEKTIPENEGVDNCCGGILENPPGERTGCEFGTSVLPCDVTTSSSVNEQNNVLGICVDSERLFNGGEKTENRILMEQASQSVWKEDPKINDDFQNKIVDQHDQEEAVIGKRRKSSVEPQKSIEGSANDAEIAEEENPNTIDDYQNKIVERHDQDKSVIGKNPKSGAEHEESVESSLDDSETEEENPKINDDSQTKGVEQHDQEASVIKDPKLGVEPEKSMKGQLDDAGIEKEEIQDREQESSGEDYIEEHDEVVSDSSDGVTEVVLRSSKRIRKRNHNVTSTNEECSRRTTRKLSLEGDENKVQKEKVITKIKSRQLITNAGFPNAKRKRLPWTAEEEEMLKEGVGKFSSTVNKNLPWKKILDFGRHVFHATRTPENLKDKWRNQTR